LHIGHIANVETPNTSGNRGGDFRQTL
jgi:hypothetical protein